MALPLILAGLVRLAPVIARVVPKIIKSIIPKTTRAKVFTVATLPALVGFGVTPTGRKVVSEVFDPRKGFERGQQFGLERDKEPKSRIVEGAKKFGLVGAVIGAAAITTAGIIKTIPKPKLPSFKKDKVLTPEDILKVTPIEDVGKQIEEPTLGAVAPTKPVSVAEKPISIKNVFQPEVNISFKKSRRFINQQILVK